MMKATLFSRSYAVVAIIFLISMLTATVKAQTVPGHAREIASLTSAEISAKVRNVSETTPAVPAIKPTDIYRIGADDVIRIELRDVPGVPKLVRVGSDGMIDFPLAGEAICVEGKTLAEVERLISGAVKLIENARVKISIYGYASHTITVWGLVDQPGDLQIQRDAVPFFVIRAMNGIDSRADRVRITRASSAATSEYPLKSSALDAILVFPGDSIEFASGPEIEH